MEVREADIPIEVNEKLQDPSSSRSYDCYYHNGARVIRLIVEIGKTAETRVIFLLSLRPDEQFILINAVSPDDSKGDLTSVIYDSNGQRTILSLEGQDKSSRVELPDAQPKVSKESLVELGFPLFTNLPERISFEALVTAFFDQIRQGKFEFPSIEAVPSEP